MIAVIIVTQLHGKFLSTNYVPSFFNESGECLAPFSHSTFGFWCPAAVFPSSRSSFHGILMGPITKYLWGGFAADRRRIRSSAAERHPCRRGQVQAGKVARDAGHEYSTSRSSTAADFLHDLYAIGPVRIRAV